MNGCFVVHVNTNYIQGEKDQQDLNVHAPGKDLCVQESKKWNPKKEKRKKGRCFIMLVLVLGAESEKLCI